MVGGSCGGGRHQLSQNIWFDKLTVVHLVHLVGRSGECECPELSQNICFYRLKVVHLVLVLVLVIVLVIVLVLVLVLVLVSVGVR